jgi:hypothetical protein
MNELNDNIEANTKLSEEKEDFVKIGFYLFLLFFLFFAEAILLMDFRLILPNNMKREIENTSVL